jgi:uncharacterized protein (DUF608 family)
MNSSNCNITGCGCRPAGGDLDRRDFLKLAGVFAAGTALSQMPAVAGPFTASDFNFTLIPADKKLSAAWLRSLVERGEPTVYRGAELEKIGMPVGGICTGQLYLGGDGRLWHWDIFNSPGDSLFSMAANLGTHYASPLKPAATLEQGFALKVSGVNGGQVRRLDQSGFPVVTFLGQYPIGTVFYRDEACPVEVKLEAYSPFIPLNAEDSGLPATVMEFTVKNTSAAKVEVELAGWLENAVCKFNPRAVGTRRNRVVRNGGTLRVDSSAEGGDPGYEVFEDFEKPGYEGWTVEGTAFGKGPVTQAEVPAYQGNVGLNGQRAVNSHASAPGDVNSKDGATGKLISRDFTIKHDLIEFLIGGGRSPGKLDLYLVVAGQVVRLATGANENKMSKQSWDVRELKGKTAHLEIVDAESGAWGNTGVDFIRFRNAGRPDIVFEDFEGGSYKGWTVEGTAFGTRPVKLSEVPAYQSPQTMGAHGEALVNSHASAIGGPSDPDQATGKLTSATFTIERRYIKFLIGGGADPDKLGLRLVVDGKMVRSATGNTDNRLRLDVFDVREFEGQKAHLEIVDDRGDLVGWGHTSVDYIVFTDEADTPISATDAPDFGTLSLSLLSSHSGDRVSADLAGGSAEQIFSSLAKGGEAMAEKPFSPLLLKELVGAVSRSMSLAPGEEQKAVFIIAWHFPRVEYTAPVITNKWNQIRDFDKLKRYYAKRFRDASEVVVYLAKDFTRLSGETKLWRQTWYDSTLPHWLLDRSFLNLSTLATTTCHRFDNDRYWFWEGVYCCQGTCTHVWHYAQAIARIFPEIERDLRERVDYGVSFTAATGVIGNRGEYDMASATDGHAGTILRTLREHQMSPDAAFLRRNWPSIKQAVEWLVGQDGKDGKVDGLITCAQPNTLDTDWFGPVSWISSLYVAALKAGAEMAREMGDAVTADRWEAIAVKGADLIRDRLFHKDQYFIQVPDPKHLDAIGSGYGCEIDQVFGQSWAWQVGLGRVLSEPHTRKALESLWRYNFTPDVGPFRQHFPSPSRRWFAMPGEGGMIMGSYPDPEHPNPVGDNANGGYFMECMSGFEYQVASHMVWEGGDLLEKGLAVSRMIHDRYHASKRNPWNEVECGDHYGRAMASYGVFTGVCGYKYHGPRGHLAFAPRLTPENFRAPFTAAEGWGTYSQKTEGGQQKVEIELKWGRLRLKTLSIVPDATLLSPRATVTLGGQRLEAKLTMGQGRAVVTFASEAVVSVCKKLELSLNA